MKIHSLASERDEAFDEARLAIRGGRLVVFPTDTLYAVACDAFNPFATALVFQVKGRPRQLPIPVFVAQPRQAWALSVEVPAVAADLAGAFWPGPLTLVLREAQGLAWDLGDAGGRLLVRMPAHDDVLELIRRVGPLAATTANRTGEPTAPSVEEIGSIFGEAVGVYLDGGPAPDRTPSTILDLTVSPPQIVREGLIAREALERVCGEVQPAAPR